MLALFLVGRASWPQVDSRRIVAVAVVLGLSYTLFSEWLNIEIRQSWAYRDIMPVVPIVDAGLSPVLQWIIVPLAAFRSEGRRVGKECVSTFSFWGVPND